MQHLHRVTRMTALVLGITGALALGQAQATGFQLRETSVKSLGRANSGTAVAEGDASVVSGNPAAMVNLDTTTVRTDVTVIDLTAKFTGGGTTAVGTPLNGGSGGDPGDPIAVPALAVVMPMTGAFEGLTLGASVSAPFGLKTEYDAAWVGRYNAITSDLKTVDLTLSAALKLHETFSIGAALVYERADVTLSNAIDYGTAICVASGVASCFNPASPFRPQANDGTVEISGDDTGFGWLFGAQWRPTDKLSIGYAHRSEIDHDLEGEADFTIPQSVAAVFGATGNMSANDGAIFAPLTTPSIDTLSVRYDFSDSFRMMADIQATDWHSLKSVTVYRSNGALLGPPEAFNWDDTMYYSLGAEFDLSDSFTLRAGVAIDETPTNNEARTPRLPDNDRNLYSVGLTWNMSSNLSIDAAYQRIEIDTPTIDVRSSSSSRLVGEFDTDSAHADLFGISAQYKF